MHPGEFKFSKKTKFDAPYCTVAAFIKMMLNRKLPFTKSDNNVALQPYAPSE